MGCVSSQSQSAEGPRTFSLLSWNIDGLDRKSTVDRALAVCDFILDKKPHAIFLQEVVPHTEEEILKKLSNCYDYYTAPKPLYGYRYFVAILVLKSKDISKKGSLESIVFPKSIMDRHVIKKRVVYDGVAINLYTSHLESPIPGNLNAEERKSQLSQVFKLITTTKPTDVSLFGGDLNLLEGDFEDVGLPPNTVDVWESCGSPQEHKYTWDPSENDNREWTGPDGSQGRLDRIYLTSCDGKVQAKSFSLVGKERLPGCGSFPSDHWGLWMEFTVNP